MTKSTGTRRLAQLACLIAVFGYGSNVVLSQAQDSGVERKILKKIDPEYPAVLRDKGIGGTVRLRVTVKPDGTVKDVQVLGGNAVLSESATRAVRQWRFSPADKEGTTDVTIHFGQHQ
jgi:TonB family protein